MTSRIRTAALALIAASTLAAAPLLVAGPASAVASGDTVVMFSNGSFTDNSAGQEDDQTFAALDATGASVATFDGGDGSASAWTTELAGADYLVFPEMEVGPVYVPGGTSAMSDAAAQVVKDYITAGGHVIFAGGYDAVDFFSFLSGLDYSGSFGNNDPNGDLILQGVNPALPATLAGVDYSGVLTDFASWPSALKAPVVPLYQDVDGALGIGTWTLGSGTYSYFAYDFYPNGLDIDGGLVDPWILAFQSLPFTVQPFPSAALANTGSTIQVAPLLGVGALVLLAGAALVLVARRRAQRA